MIAGWESPPGTASASTDPPIRSTLLYKILYLQLLQWEARNIQHLERPKKGPDLKKNLYLAIRAHSLGQKYQVEIASHSLAILTEFYYHHGL
jgi:hypothetical protein